MTNCFLTKPRWTSDSEDRISWEWRRVRRSFGRIEREQLVADLQYWNNVLKNIFEKAEIPSDESNPLLEEIQARFNQRNCDNARRDYRRMHEMLSNRWTCSCQEHKGNIRLDWHASKIAPADKLSLTIPSDNCSQWHHISMNFHTTGNSSATQLTNISGNILPLVPRAPSPSKREKLKGLFSTSKEIRSSTQSLTIPMSKRPFSSLIFACLRISSIPLTVFSSPNPATYKFKPETRDTLPL